MLSVDELNRLNYENQCRKFGFDEYEVDHHVYGHDPISKPRVSYSMFGGTQYDEDRFYPIHIRFVYKGTQYDLIMYPELKEAESSDSILGITLYRVNYWKEDDAATEQEFIRILKEQVQGYGSIEE